MKRRSFIKVLMAGLLSPFIPSGSHSAENAMPAAAPRTWQEERYAENHGLYPDTIILDQRRSPWCKHDEHSHLCDSLQYAMMDYKYYAHGHQWSEVQRAQSKLNKHLSLMLNKIATVKKR
jgi:hypothetical protein